MPDLKEKVVIITGASSGIGKGTAEYFASLGARLVLSGRDETALGKTKEACISSGAANDNILIVKAEATSLDDSKNLVDSTVKKFGRIDSLINSAGVVLTGSTEDKSMEDYDWVMNINTRSIVQLTKLALPHLKESKGTIVNVSSINGPCSFAGVTFYCMSKAAIDQFTKCLALEMSKTGVRVNAVNPGVIVTDIHKRAGMNDEKYAQFLEHSKTTHAMGRVGEVGEVAKAIGFLASSDSSFTTGELLRVDGGRGIMAPR